MLVQRLTMMPIECVVRGYLAGSGWKDYQDTGSICGQRLPPGLHESDRLPEPIFTPATKATSGHDINIDADTAALLVGDEPRYQTLERISLDGGLPSPQIACCRPSGRGTAREALSSSARFASP